MQKIPTVFTRDYSTVRRYVTDQVAPGCEWVFTDRGVRGTRKYDGVCVQFDGEKWWTRHIVKPGKSTPDNFSVIEHDDTTGNTVGWIPAEQSGYAKYIRKAIDEAEGDIEEPGTWPVGTYELVGPKVNGNPERYEHHWLLLHSTAEICMRGTITVDDVREMVLMLKRKENQEGIVFHHPDGRMAKIKARDFAPEVAA